MAVDPALTKALGLDPSTALMTTSGGSGFASTFKLTGVREGEEVAFFVKSGGGPDAELMFRGEHASLNAIHSVVPSLCPRSHAHGPLSDGRFFLATDFLDLSPRPTTSSPRTSGQSLAQKLAKLHTTSAPAPPGSATPMFGFPVSTCCGATAQPNPWTPSWAAFYAEHRLLAILSSCPADPALSSAVGRVASEVVPRLLGDGHLAGAYPVVVHGDLWSGNRGRARVVAGAGGSGGGGGGGGGPVEEMVFDPSCVYGHSEYELGIMRMFGGFGAAFWREYEALVPRSEPAAEWEDRLLLYELYHHLNHAALFGGGYRGSSMSIMNKLLAKYGGGEVRTTDM